MTTFIIYIAGVLKPVSILLFAIAASIFAFFVIAYPLLCSEYGENAVSKTFGKTFKPCMIFAVMLTFLGIMIPNQETIYLMLGSTYAESQPQTEEGKKVRLILNKKLDEMLKESK